MVGSEDALYVVEGLSSEFECFCVIACRVVVLGEVVAACEGVGVVGSEDAFLVVEGLLSELECFCVVACRVVVAGEIVAALEGVGVGQGKCRSNGVIAPLIGVCGAIKPFRPAIVSYETMRSSIGCSVQVNARGCCGRR